MDKILNITQTKENPIEFDVKVDGIKTEDMNVYFDIHTSKFSIGITCNQVGEKWVAVIPPLNFLEKTMYSFTIIVVADGYYFEPFKGSINIMSSPEIYVTIDKTEKIKPKEEVIDKGPVKQIDLFNKSKEEPKQNIFDKSFGDKTIQDILDGIKPKMESQVSKKKGFKDSMIIESNLDIQPDFNIKDINVKNILDGLKKSDKIKERVKPVAVKIINKAPEVKNQVKELELEIPAILNIKDINVKNILDGLKSSDMIKGVKNNQVKQGAIKVI